MNAGVPPTQDGFDPARHNSQEAPPAGEAVAPPLDTAGLPKLYRDHSFWGMITTQFLGAFNDNIFKQLMLLVSLKIVEGEDRQWLASFVFSAPFLLFSGYAGFLADRFSKRRVIILCKMAEIGIMLLGVVAFLNFSQFGFAGVLAVLFLMGSHSAFFGPSKYGILPEMLRPGDLPNANGIMLMTTFLAIIFGGALGGFLSDQLTCKGAFAATASNLWIVSAICVEIALLGTLAARRVRRVPPAVPGLRFRFSSLTIPPETRQMLRNDRRLLGAVLASSIFWLVAGVAPMAVNSLGVTQLKLSDAWASVLMVCIGVGIMIGSILAGMLSRGVADFRLMRWGGWGLIAALLVLALPGPIHGHLLGFWGSLVALIVMGMFAGMYAIPLQVFMQSRPPDGQKGRMIAVMNQANFAAIFISSGVYWIFDRIVVWCDWPRCVIFALTAVIMLIAVLLYRPQVHSAAQ
jgi:acyl-[acyl-carrier-protein]-phospholipid O-acyltransferase/long-chain-fatty-acid--[acyl-carrier-protein] ligase